VRAMYDETVDFIAGEGYPGDSDGSGMITLNDIKLALRIGAGFGDSAGGGVVFENADADASGRIDFRDAALIARYMYGLQTTMP
ncbi:MAG: EF-hand domain-containing protein, partial [Armatimonadetes bacterium]|nr:EF-hand domain-containing protein [Armatimonadota bacterium]